MTTPYRILAAVDLSDWSERVYRTALRLAKDRGMCEVHLLAVAALSDSPFSLSPNAGKVPPEAIEKLKKYAHEKLEAFGKEEGDGQFTVTAHVLLGSPSEQIVWLAAHLDADVIVMGTHGRRGLKRFLMGSVAERVTRAAGCAVYVVRPKEHDPEIKVPEIEPPPSKEHPAHLLENHHYTPVGPPRTDMPAWGGFNL